MGIAGKGIEIIYTENNSNMKAINVFTHPICPGCYSVAVIDDGGGLLVKYYKVEAGTITETDDKRVRRVLDRRIRLWKAKVPELVG